MDDLTEVLSVVDAGRVERRVLAYGRRTNPSRFRDSIRYHVIKIDPASAERRRAAARQDRDVTYMAGEDGVGHLGAALTAEEALAAHQQIDKLARKARTPDRTLGQCRADVLLGLIFGEQRERVKVQVNVTVPATTVKRRSHIHPLNWEDVASRYGGVRRGGQRSRGSPPPATPRATIPA
ncbi:DUF222 domain-containing protein [Actinocrispum wychmicini]|uniref:Uncharacterized protein DUF222 n=1 Tax=Actinocrispum wychmicini TaxID=1213861 RepID=A0A4R2J9Z7_9PSEU|nr:DUF222 domain-containing protein [Actinocrispum wychmicini]TCO53506.1 uncharacterized protein DUF222 [Actinocrispum wychmicini]